MFTDSPAAMAFTPPTTASPMLQQIQNETIGKNLPFHASITQFLGPFRELTSFDIKMRYFLSFYV